ncbi:MAG: hypothetical protein WED15_07270 [Akkermansiaceae bacterium]
MKLKLIFAATFLVLASHASAATYYINNAVAGDTSDTLFLNENGGLLDGGIISIGYFATTGPSSSLTDIATTISNFTLIHSVLAGSFSADLEAALAGYAQSPDALRFQGATITAPNTLIGKAVYLFAGNAATLAGSTAWALAEVGIIADDVPFEQEYNASPGGAVILGDIGTFTTFTGGSGAAVGTFAALQLSAIPEPSAALLGALGVLGLLRRRRI